MPYPDRNAPLPHGDRSPSSALRRRFPGAAVLAPAVLFDADGRRAFSGGITAGRGHRGDSPGRRALLAALRDGAAPAREAPVFGYPLFAEIDP